MKPLPAVKPAHPVLLLPLSTQLTEDGTARGSSRRDSASSRSGWRSLAAEASDRRLQRSHSRLQTKLQQRVGVRVAVVGAAGAMGVITSAALADVIPVGRCVAEEELKACELEA